MNYVVKIDKEEHIEFILRHKMFKIHIHNHLFNKFININGYVSKTNSPFNKKLEISDLIEGTKNIGMKWMFLKIDNISYSARENLPYEYVNFKQLSSTQLFRNEKLKRINGSNKK